MSNVPIRPTDAVHAYLSELPAVVAAAREQGRLDIRTFLCRRAVELRPGAPLLFHLPVMGQEADAKPVPHVFVHRAVRAMLVDGRLKGEEAAAMTAHEFYRPAADVVGELAAAAGDWHVRRAEEISVELPGYAELARGEYTAERVAALTVDMLRAAFTDIYVAGLSASRPAAEAAQVVEALFAQAQALATTTPGAVAVHWLYVWLVRK